MIDCHVGGVPITVDAPRNEMSDPSRAPTPAEVDTFVSLYCQLLDEQRTDVMVTYGGRWVGQKLIHEAQRRGIRVVFWSRNTQYTDRSWEVPAAEEVAPWVETIIRLRDDPHRYEQASSRTRSQAA